MGISRPPKSAMHLITKIYKLKYDKETKLTYSKPGVYLGWNFK